MGDKAATVDKPTFESCYPEIKQIVASRKGAWTYVSLVEWNDVASIVTARIWRQWKLFDPAKGPLENWANTVISRALLNLRRDNALRYARPCIKQCVYNLGGDSCEITKSGKQCAECPLYKDWEQGRKHQFNIKSTVSLENHTQEVHNKPEEHCDIEGIQNTLHKRMQEELTKWEYRIFVCLYIKHMTPTETSAALEAVAKKWKRAPRADERWDYPFILEQQRWCKQMMYRVLLQEGYDLEAAQNHDR